MTDRKLRALYDRLGYQFQDEDLLRQALRHPSFTHENPQYGDHNQRLEFLGDAVVGLTVAEALLHRFPDSREGELTRMRAALVSERPLAEVAHDLGLGELIMLGKGEDHGGGRERPSLLSDALEALVGAAFLDGGIDAARQVIESILGDQLDEIHDVATVDHKSMLQEKLQTNGDVPLKYEVVKTSGPDHDKRFEVELVLGEEVLGHGRGSSKKAAEQAAAKQALRGLNEETAERGS